VEKKGVEVGGSLNNLQTQVTGGASEEDTTAKEASIERKERRGNAPEAIG